MAGYEKLAAELKTLAESTATSRPVAQKAVDKLALGRQFQSNEFSAFNITVTQPLADGDVLIRHAPPDGDNILLYQNTSDNSLSIHNESSGNTSAWFYPNGRAYVDLTSNAIENRHYDSLSITNGKVADLTLTNGKVANSTLTGGKLVPGTLGFPNYADASIGDQKIYNAGVKDQHIAGSNVVYSHMNSDTKNRGTSTSSMRSIGLGSSTSAAGSNHVHLSVNFNSQYTIEQKEIAANLVTTVRDMQIQPQLAPLRDLVLELAHQLMDEPDITVQEKVNRIKTDPAYAHEFRMKHDPEYYAAWAMDNAPEYAAVNVDDPKIQEMSAHARQVYPRIENDPAIVQDYKGRHGPFA